MTTWFDLNGTRIRLSEVVAYYWDKTGLMVICLKGYGHSQRLFVECDEAWAEKLDAALNPPAPSGPKPGSATLLDIGH
jgi:hypothetical protein